METHIVGILTLVDKIINNTATASTTATLLGLSFNYYQRLEPQTPSSKYRSQHKYLYK